MNNQKPGRKPFEPTDAQRQQVEVWAIGMRHDDIATALGISAPTLRKHFEDELSSGPHRRRAALLETLYSSALSGNVSAARTLEAMRAAMLAADDEGIAPATVKIGKKEAAQRAAETAGGPGTIWGDDLNVPLWSGRG